MKQKRALLGALAAAAFAATGTSVQAGTATFDFSTDPNTIVDARFGGNNDQIWQQAGGNPGGFLALTYSQNSQDAMIIFPDIDAGKIVTAFSFQADLRIGNPTGDRPADGFSVSFARAGDPILENDFAYGNFAGGAPENGATTGIAVNFDTWSGNALPDGADIEGIIVRVDNVTVLRQALPTRNGACADTTTLQTGPRDPAYWAAGGDARAPEAWAGLCWQPFSVELDAAGKLTVKWKGATLLDQFQTTFFPSAGRLVFAGRTGGANEQTHVDNLRLTTTSVADSTPPTAPTALVATSTGASRVALGWGPSTDDAGRVAYEVERDGVKINANLVTTESYVDTGAKPGTTHAYRVRAVDVAGNPSAYATLSVTTVALVPSPGFVLGEIYANIPGTPVQGLLDDPKYPASPDRRVYLNGISFGEPAFGDTYGENHGVRITGTLTVPTSGDYHFFVRSDDASQFFLNTTGPAIPVPAASTPIAQEDGCCGAFQEPGVDTRTTATPIALTAGTQYGFNFLVKEGGGGDWGQVAMRKSDDTTPAANLSPIRGGLVTGVADPVGASVNISQQPQSQTVTANDAVTLSVTATGTNLYGAPVSYQWYKNGAILSGANAATYNIPVVPVTDNSAKFTVRVNTAGASVLSSEATLTVNTDTKPATVTSAVGADNFTEVTLTFSEPVTAPTATTAGNYALNGGVTVSAATLVNPSTVRLTTSRQAEDTAYTVTVTNVRDNAANPVAAGTTGSFTSWKLVPNRVKIERYNDIAGTPTQGLYDDPKYQAGTPDVISYLTGLTFGEPAFGNTYGENFGAVLRGYLIPTQAGAYDFFVRSDDASQLFINTTGQTWPVPGTDAPIAEETGCCEGFKEPSPDVGQPYETTSTPITLTAGTRYPVIFVVKEGGGGDWGQVAMRRVGDTTAAGSLTPISNDIWYFGPPAPVASSQDITSPTDIITGFGGTWPGGEVPANAFNNNTLKYLNFGADPTAAPFVGPVGLIVTPASGATLVTGARFYTANDAVDRDPVDYTLEGSKDGVSFTLISSNALALPATRNAASLPLTGAVMQEVTFANTESYVTYRLTFTNVKNNTAANSMQIGEIELLGTVTGPGRPTLAVTRAGANATITWSGGTLESSATVNTGYTPVAGATGGTHTVPATGTRFYRAR